MAEEETTTGVNQGAGKTTTVRAVSTAPSNGLEASLLSAGATGLEFVGNGNNADMVSLIKEAAIFKYDVDAEDVGTLGPEWKPGSGKQPLGYFSEDGITIHPEAGDDNDFTAHNGDTVVSMTSGGYWTVQFAALEGKKEVIETYFDTTVQSDGSITVDTSDIKKYAQYVIAGLTQTEKLILLHIPKAKVSERDDIAWTISDLQNFNMTLRAFKGGTTAPYLFKAWGFAQDVPAAD